MPQSLSDDLTAFRALTADQRESALFSIGASPEEWAAGFIDEILEGVYDEQIEDISDALSQRMGELGLAVVGTGPAPMSQAIGSTIEWNGETLHTNRSYVMERAPGVSGNRGTRYYGALCRPVYITRGNLHCVGIRDSDTKRSGSATLVGVPFYLRGSANSGVVLKEAYVESCPGWGDDSDHHNCESGVWQQDSRGNSKRLPAQEVIVGTPDPNKTVEQCYECARAQKTWDVKHAAIMKQRKIEDDVARIQARKADQKAGKTPVKAAAPVRKTNNVQRPAGKQIAPLARTGRVRRGVR